MPTAHFTSGGEGGESPPGGGQYPGGSELEDDNDDPRRVAHELLGQAHAVLVIATKDEVLHYWCPPDLHQSFRDARIPLWVTVGDAQVGIGGGSHDEALRANGIGGPLSRHKRKGLRAALQRLVAALPTGDGDGIRAWMRSAAGLARTAVGSLVREIPGGEIIGEALDGITAGLDTLDAHATSKPKPADGPTTKI